MAEPKPLASLTSGLLARKGSAAPAMRRPMISGFGGSYTGSSNDDLGWNDMGIDHGSSADIVPLAGLTPMPAPPPPPPVVTERAALSERVAPAARAPIKAPIVGRKSAFTLRLDAERHLKLRLACAVLGRSAQHIVSEALDAFLQGQPEIDRLAKQLPFGRGQNGTKGG